MLGAALDLASAGWPVLPCIPTGPKAKAPLLPNGFKDAATDPEVIRAWWSQWPAALIGISIPEHLLVLDTDPRNGGDYGKLEELLGELPVTLTSWSGRGDGGRHLWFHRPAGQVSSRRLPAGVDLKLGGRGYVIAPPSLHPATGAPYRWEHHDIARLPVRVAEILRVPSPGPHPVVPHQRPQTAGDGLVRVVAESVEGQRNDRLFWAACRAHESGDALIVHRVFEAALMVGLTEQEAARTIGSAKHAVGGGAA